MRNRTVSLLMIIGMMTGVMVSAASATQVSPDIANNRNHALLHPTSLSGLSSDISDALNPIETLVHPSLPLSDSLVAAHPSDIGTTDALIEWVLKHDVVATLASGQPIFMPLQRPYPAVAWGGIDVSISVPTLRPDIETLLPPATLTLADFAAREKLGAIVEEEVYTLKKGETLAKLLKRAGMSPEAQYPLIQEMGRKLNPRRLQIGMTFTIGKSADGTVAAMQFPLADAMSYYLMKSDDLGWFGLQAIRPVDTLLVHASAVIDGALYDTAKSANVPVKALEEFVRVMGFTVDFQRQLRKGDSFALIYERTIDRLTGEELDAGKLHYANMNLSGEPLHFFRHEHRDGQMGWYDETGASAVRTLMRTPVNGARISSNYGMRRHPTKGYNAMHKGVDFAVPTGTPIVAAGSGRVEAAGWNGSYGRYIRIRHSGTYKTAYAHLSRIASGIGPGSIVKQGQVIGFVGSSGRSTGPHLHYEILVNNRKVNPMTIKLPTGKGLDGTELGIFKKQLEQLVAYLDADQQVLFAER